MMCCFKQCMEYELADQYGKDDSLYPKDPKKRALVDQRLDFDIGTLYQRFGDYYAVRYVLWIYVLICMASGPEGARILGIFPMPSISHQSTFQAIMKALAARGHQITVITTEPLKKPVPNYTDIDISFSYKYFRSSFDFAKMDQATSFQFVSQIIPVFSKMGDDQLSSPQLQEFIKSTSNNSYDLVFLQALIFQCYYGLIHHLGSPPVIGIMSNQAAAEALDSIGTITNPSYIPNIYTYYSDHMTFYERLQNTLFWLWLRYKIYLEEFPLQESIMRKHFGAAPPPVYEAERNMNLLMVATNWLFTYPTPLVPTVITFHNLHVKTKPDLLPEDLQKFLDEATDGVIYFSLGSNVFSNRMPEEKRRIFIEAFSELPQKVLWKWESDTLPGKPPNLRVGKWMPQQDILAHPNVKLFITQCGLQSFQEAVYHGVPILGIPFIIDQKYNARKIQEAGLGLQLTFKEITKDSLANAINQILKNTSFRDNAKKLSTLSRDFPQTSIEKAVWWTEYVLRHKGAKHLRSAALDLEWYQYLLLDVAAFLLMLTLIMISILYYLCKTLHCYVIEKTKIKSKYE